MCMPKKIMLCKIMLYEGLLILSVKYGTNSLVVVEKTSNNFIKKRVLGDVSYSNAPLILAKNKIFAN